MSRGEAGICIDDLLEQFCGLGRSLAMIHTVEQRKRFQVQLVRLHVGVIASLSPAQRQSKLIDDRPRDFVLNGEDVLELAIEPLGP